MAFFDDNVLLENATARKLYNEIKNLPIVDYHCHLDQRKIAQNEGFGDIGEMWLGGDHYKWRAMRMCGVDEKYITGDACFHDKFVKYAEIVPQLVGNPLYYWTHMELKQIFGINKPLNASTAEEIYAQANKVLQNVKVADLLDKFRVEFIATTDDPSDSLEFHGRYGNTTVAPTFRPDNLYRFDGQYLAKLGATEGTEIDSLDSLLCVLQKRLDFFTSKGCKFSDHGFDAFPRRYATQAEAAEIFALKGNASGEQQDAFFGFLLVWLAKQYAKRGITMQIHFAVTRNVNPQMFRAAGCDSGFDVISEQPSVQSVLGFLRQIPDEERPQTVLYCLNASNLEAIATLTGAFRNVRMGAAWWFNDTVGGIKRNLNAIAEYSVLGTNLGMLTDSRSFSSYCRFDFFRRLLCSFVGERVEKGEYDFAAASALLCDVCYNNAKKLTQ